MNRRDLILGSALGLAAAGASAQAQTKAGGVSVPSYYGQVAEIAFTTSADLQAFMPPGLTVVDPHKAFVKAERADTAAPADTPAVADAGLTQDEKIKAKWDRSPALQAEFGGNYANFAALEKADSAGQVRILSGNK